MVPWPPQMKEAVRRQPETAKRKDTAVRWRGVEAPPGAAAFLSYLEAPPALLRWAIRWGVRMGSDRRKREPREPPLANGRH